MLPTDLKKIQHLGELFSSGTANSSDLKALSELLSFLKQPNGDKSQKLVDKKRSA